MLTRVLFQQRHVRVGAPQVLQLHPRPLLPGRSSCGPSTSDCNVVLARGRDDRSLQADLCGHYCRGLLHGEVCVRGPEPGSRERRDVLHHRRLQPPPAPPSAERILGAAVLPGRGRLQPAHARDISQVLADSSSCAWATAAAPACDLQSTDALALLVWPAGSFDTCGRAVIFCIDCTNNPDCDVVPDALKDLLAMGCTPQDIAARTPVQVSPRGMVAAVVCVCVCARAYATIPMRQASARRCTSGSRRQRATSRSASPRTRSAPATSPTSRAAAPAAATPRRRRRAPRRAPRRTRRWSSAAPAACRTRPAR